MTGQTPDLSRRAVASFVIAAGLIALASIVALDAANHGAAPAYSRVGPGATAYAIAAGLAILGLATGIAAWRGMVPEGEPYDPGAVFLILGGLGGLMAAIAFGGGFIVGATILFAATARAFGRTQLIADIAIGVTLSLSVYLLFTKLLSLSLPQGPLERLF